MIQIYESGVLVFAIYTVIVVIINGISLFLQYCNYYVNDIEDREYKLLIKQFILQGENVIGAENMAFVIGELIIATIFWPLAIFFLPVIFFLSKARDVIRYKKSVEERLTSLEKRRR